MKFRVISSNGDDVMEFDLADVDQRVSAQEQFRTLISEGYMAVAPDSPKGEVVFDMPVAEETVVFLFPLAGG